MQAIIHSRRIAPLFACLMAGAVLCAQQPAGIQKQDDVYTLHADTHLVLLDVTITDKQRHPVSGLTKDDFNLTEDGQPQTIKFFEEHAPVDPAETARQKAAAIAGQPLNTFTNYEAFTGRPVTALLVNELFPVMMNHLDQDPLVRRMEQDPLYLQTVQDATHQWRIKDPELDRVVHDPQISRKILLALGLRRSWESDRQTMLDIVRSAPPDTPFALYVLDSQLRLMQSITTDRALLQARIDLLWKVATPHFGSEQMINTTGLPPEAEIPVRRRIFTDAVQQLASSLEGVQGRKNLYVFTGPFQCSVVGSVHCPDMPFPNDDYLCRLMDTLEQGRMSIYRYYGGDNIAYGFGCLTSINLGTSASYYTLYYTPTNADWNGKYRATKVEVTEKDLQLKYRKGYYGTPENVEAHYYKRRGDAPIVPTSGGSTIAASTVAEETADPDSPGTGAAPAPPNPASSVFTVQVVPASAPSATDNDTQEYRQLTLHFSMPASEFRVMRSDGGQYVARLQISAVGYSDGKVASSNGSQAVQMAVNFKGAADPRIATSTITAELSLNELEHGKDRWLLLTVRDQTTGQFGSLVIPMAQVKMPGTPYPNN